MNLRNTILFVSLAFSVSCLAQLFVRQTPVKRNWFEGLCETRLPPVPDVVPLDMPGASCWIFGLKDNFVECYPFTPKGLTTKAGSYRMLSWQSLKYTPELRAGTYQRLERRAGKAGGPRERQQ